MEAQFFRGKNQLSTLKSQQASYLDNINQMILKDEDFEYMHVPALAQRLEIYKRKFLEFDQDSSGYLDYNEFKEMLHAIGAAKSDAKCKKLFKRCRQSTRNVLYYRDFVDMVLADTLKLGIMFDEEQDIINKVEMMQMQKNSKRTSSSSEISTISDGMHDKGMQSEDAKHVEGHHGEERGEEERYREDHRTTVDRGVQYSESSYDDQQSVFSYRSNNQDNEEEEDQEEDEEEQDDEEEEEDDQDEDEDEEEEEDGDEDEVDQSGDGIREQDVEDGRQEDEEGGEVREVKEVRQPAMVDQISRGVEQVQLLRSEPPQGQIQTRRPPSYRRLATNTVNTQQRQVAVAHTAAHTAVQTAVATANNNTQQLVPISNPRTVANPNTELYPSLVQAPGTRTIPGGNPPPMVCTTRSLPPEAGTKIPVAVRRPVSPAPYTYVCTDPNCPDSYPKPPPPPPICRDPNCPYNRPLHQHYEPYTPPLEYVPEPAPYTEYRQPVIQSTTTCPYGHRCVSPQPGYDMLPVQSVRPAASYAYTAHGSYTDPEQMYYGNQLDQAYLDYGAAQPYYVVME